MNRIEHVRLSVIREGSALYASNKIFSPSDAAAIATQYIGDADREHCVVLCLDTKNKVNAISTLSIGTLNAAHLHPREVFKIALSANAASIVLAHNHPSGDTTPSAEDIDVTGRVAAAGEMIGVQLLDHVVVAYDGGYTSLKERGLF